MRQSILLLLFCCGFAPLFAQSVSINTDGSTAHSSSILEVRSTNKGMLVPRMTAVQRDAIAAPATGLLVYNTDANVFQFRNGSTWVNLNSEKILTDADGDTKIQVEESPNDNTIRFDISGDERMTLRENASGVLGLDLDDSQNNTFVGTLVGFNTTTGSFNTAFGYSSLKDNTTGIGNIAVGPSALNSNTTGSSNAAFGGSGLCDNTSGELNVAIGSGSLFKNLTGNGNTGVGYSALRTNSTSSNNAALGHHAGFSFLHGDGNTFLGSETQANADGYTNSTALGYQTAITASHQVRVGDVNVTSIGGFQNWTTLPSDARFKTNVRENVPGLAFVNKLRPVTYQIDIEGIHRYVGQSKSGTPNPEASAQIRTGFLAQEVEKAARELGFDFDGVDAPKNEKDLYGLRYAEFTVPLVKAVQELDAENKQLIELIKKQSEEMLALKTRTETIEASLRTLSQR